jgi:8-amino-7-oxononanoate synthase
MPGAALAQGLAALDAAGLRRSRRVLESPQGPEVVVDGRPLANFSSNDYLGLANHPRLRTAAHAAIDAFGVGAGASPLVSGHLRAHEEAERRFARFIGLPRALLFPSGYAANLGIVSALCDRHAEVFGDRLNHACLNDGAILSRATFTRYRHLDVEGLERSLAASRAGVKLIATDSVFSMDGDLAPLPAILGLAERHGAWMLVDDAHGVGVLGETGHGCVEHFALDSPRVIVMATLGKALGGYGAAVVGDADLIEHLMQTARPYIYTTALPPAQAAATLAAVKLARTEEWRRAKLYDLIAHFREKAAHAGLVLLPSETPIQPVMCGSDTRALSMSATLEQRGYWVTAIRPPTVPEGRARLRVTLSALHTHGDVDGLVDALGRARDKAEAEARVAEMLR